VQEVWEQEHQFQYEKSVGLLGPLSEQANLSGQLLEQEPLAG
jgi:hypothetical protein